MFKLNKFFQQLHKNKAAGLFLGLTFITAIIGSFFYFSKNSTQGPEAVPLVVKQFQTPYQRQIISAADGGTVSVDEQLEIAFPAEFTDQDVVASFRQIESPRLTASNQVGSMFELTARVSDNPDQLISQFNQPLTITLSPSDAVLEIAQEQGHDLADLQLYFFNEDSQEWEVLESSFNQESGELIATTSHFTVFTLAADDPNAGGAGAQATGAIVDDSDPEPFFVPGGMSDGTQPQFWGQVGSGYNGGAIYTGNSVDNTPRNWATWSISDGLTGEVEVFATVPDPLGLPLTSGATYVVSHAGGDTAVVIDQQAARGSVVSLGTFTFAGSGSVYLNDVVPEQGTNFASHIVFDAISFGDPIGQSDFTPPLIEDVRAFSDSGKFRINAKVTDEGSGVAEVYLVFNGQAYPMDAMGDDRYAVDVAYQANIELDYFIVAYDAAGNEGVWSPQFGYITRGAFYRLTGLYPGMVKAPGSNCNTTGSCDPAAVKRSQIVGHPVNTVNGNLIEEISLVEVGGRPEIEFGLTYNNQSGRPSIFGENWTHSYNYHATEVNTPEKQAVFIQYPDGKVVEFDGTTLEPEPGYFETLEREGGGFILTMTDLSQLYFDGDGDITRWEDANDNGLNFSYGEKFAWTLMSELTEITADGGRSIQLSFNDAGLVETLTAPEGKNLSFNYSDENDLTSWVNARGGTTAYNYADHNMTEATTPEGFVYMTNSFDGDRRVVEHHVGEDFHNSFEYSADETVVTDSNNIAVRYAFNDDDLLESITDALGNSVSYSFTAEKQIASITDEENATTEFEYDARGNNILEKDALGAEITRTFDQTFNKPLTEVNKIADHTTTWSYDSKGNLLSQTNAVGATQTMTYDSFGQLLTESDYVGNTTTHTYSSEGDRATTTDPESNFEQYSYDGLGRLISVLNPRSFTYTYSYDGNDNLIQVEGPIGYQLGYVYDANDRLITETDANGGDITYSYDNSNNLISETDQLSQTTSYSYGLMNELLEVTTPRGQVTNYNYDDAYNLISATEAVGTADERTTTFEYSGRHEQTAVIDAEGRRHEFEFDELSRLTKETNNAVLGLSTATQNVTTKYVYNATSGIVEVIDANNNSTLYELDALDRVTASSDAENQTTSYSYDGQSNTLSTTNPRGFTTTFEYDGLNRLDTSTNAKGGTRNYSYDPNSNMVAVTDENAITTGYEFDELDRRVAQIKNFKPGDPSTADTNVTTGYNYDLHGNLIAVTNPRGFTTAFSYDPTHRQTVITDAVGNSTQLAYDPDDNLTSRNDRNSNVWSYQHDWLNRLTQSANPENHSRQYVYDNVDNTLQFTNERGNSWTSQYDPLNRVSSITDPLAGVRSYDYDAMGNLLSLDDENGHTDSFEYDKIYRMTASSDAEGNTTSYEYDENSNLVTSTDAETNPTAMAYDELDRLIERTNAENETEEYAYDGTTNLTLQTEADGTPHEFEYDPIYRLITVVNNLRASQPASDDTNVATRYRYDANGNQIAQINPNAAVTQFEYDALDRQITEINPLANTWQYSYDAEGNLTQRLDANQATTNYQYYPDYQLNVIDYPEYDVRYTYSETNFPLSMQDNLGSSTWEYDALDRMITQDDPFQRNLSYSYDPVGNLTQLTYPDGRSVAHNYLKNDWLQQSKTSDDDGVEYSRNKVGVPTTIARTNQTAAELSYDKVYRPLEIYDRELAQKQSLVNKYSYSYNEVGHITEEVANYGWRQPDQVTTNYEYDGLHRLAVAASDDDQRSEYRYDPAGNRVHLTEQLKQGAEQRSYSYNAANQLTQVGIESPLPPRDLVHSYSYDANGNRIDKSTTDATGLDRGVAYSYDTENRLTKAQDYQLHIAETETASPSAQPCQPGQGKNNGKDASADCNNGAGNDNKNTAVVPPASSSAVVATPTINEKANTRYEYDGNGRRLVSTYFAGSSDEGKRTEYTFDRLDPVAEYSMWNGQRKNLYRNSAQDLIAFQDFKSEQDPKGTLYFYHHDGEGNISATTKHSGQSDHGYRFDEYGSILPENGNTATNRNEGSNGWIEPHNTYSLSQKQYDGNTNLYYFGSRFYDPEVGTWINQDSYRGQVSNPQSLHRYLYNYSSPVNYVDEYGFDANITYNKDEDKIYVTTTIEIHGNDIENIDYIANEWETGINEKWNGYQYYGVDVVFEVDVFNGSSGCENGDNCIKVLNSDQSTEVCPEGRSCTYNWRDHESDGQTYYQPNRGEVYIHDNKAESVRAISHEVGHLCGYSSDDYSPGYSKIPGHEVAQAGFGNDGHESTEANNYQHIMGVGLNVHKHEVEDLMTSEVKNDVKKEHWIRVTFMDVKQFLGFD